MNTPFFSIIIPVYNGLTHDLPVCLNSIWEQSLDKQLYEVICVDDCSTDGTRQWLKEEQSKHPNLIVIENERNIRQGGSRNKGMLAAKGAYIIFIDQDDYFHNGSIKMVYDHLQKNKIEVLIVDAVYESPGKIGHKLQHNFSHKEIMAGDEIIVKNSIPYAPWKFIFQRTHIIENKLFFNQNERIEDVDWVHKLVHYAKRVQYQPILFIHYIKNRISTTMTAYKSGETIYSTLRCAQRMHTMIDTVFADSDNSVKVKIRVISETIGYLGLRNYLFFYDKIETKSNNIKTNLNEITGSHFILRFAKKMPHIFSLVSNITSPFARCLMFIYQYIKYR